MGKTLSLLDILSHEELAVGAFSEEVFWSLSLSGRPLGFVIYRPIEDEIRMCYFTLCSASVRQVKVER